MEGLSCIQSGKRHKEMTEEQIKLFRSHNLKVWIDNKNRYCIYGQAGTIATCLRATRAKYIQIEEVKYKIEDVTHQIYQMTEIKLAFKKLIYEEKDPV